MLIINVGVTKPEEWSCTTCKFDSGNVNFKCTGSVAVRNFNVCQRSKVKTGERAEWNTECSKVCYRATDVVAQCYSRTGATGRTYLNLAPFRYTHRSECNTHFIISSGRNIEQWRIKTGRRIS